ncbi:Alcohol dehydrogenase zinc-binding domain protein [Thermaerobacter marianensis DSM 12885]|uniref:Alcohol dehydrogenase zinc-binding domain protein n=1 Tax=Thermaerobacter marianensis (strain ATCC 700841 / DSM 12885 / JCM 10246 / 7p75a) TaxID=644966 RepID=E6SK58_THEM7|nr:zinc-dependent alcohol dehydrogenase family protein [Thermaerobacter marianensis]ADU51199.1 Alcohol dehydrogenase zinc-binding domain protein [Thermaerobacter marianensis DSM 12885]
MAETMKAMFIRSFGGPEVFEERQVPVPEPGPGEVLVEVHATSVNPVDYKIRRNGTWAGVRPPAIIGYDVSGVVAAVGPGVTDFKPGDEVYYTPEIFGGRPGSYAPYHVARQEIVARKPENLSHTEAAAVPLAGGTAWDALITRGGLRVGETVLIHGAAGGVGHFAVQIAKAAGAFVYATARAENAEFVKSLGADRVIDYRTQDFVEIIRQETGGRGVDLVLDTVGGDVLTRSFEVTRPHGRVVTILGGGQVNLSIAYPKNLTIHGLFLERARYKLDALRTLIEGGRLRPALDGILPLNQVAEAHARLEEGGVRGKIVLRVRP